MTERPFRQSVVGVFVNDRGKVLLGERSDAPGSWQLPQGGIDEGESPEDALRREMREELGVNRFRILRQGAMKCRYDFPAALDAPVARKYRGQEQTWFLLRFDDGAGPAPEAADGEFRDFRWDEPAQALAGIIEWKRQCYEDGFRSLGIETKRQD